jgi:rhamnosyltransferase subunit B
VNVLLLALGSHGDVHPFVGIGLRLRERGHHAAVAANAYFKPLIDHANLEFIELGTAEEYKRLAMDRDLWHPMRSLQAVFGGTARYFRTLYDVTVDFCRRPDSVVAASSLALGARVAQDKFDLPLASVHMSPSIFQSAYALPNLPGFNVIPTWAPLAVKKLALRAMSASVDALIAPALNNFRAEVGLGPVRDVLINYWHSPRRVIALFPEWFCPPQPDWPAQTRLAGFPLYDEPDLSPIDSELEAFLRAGEPPIAFTPGSAMWQAHGFFAESADACRRLGRRGLLLTRHRDHLPTTLPPSVIHVHYAPFSQLLPRCAAFVHHGGIGSSAQALASGVRQLVTPFTHDQPDNAARLKRLGVANVLPPTNYTSDLIAARLRRLLESPDVGRCCRLAKSRFAGVDAIGAACDLIEHL